MINYLSALILIINLLSQDNDWLSGNMKQNTQEVNYLNLAPWAYTIIKSNGYNKDYSIFLDKNPYMYYADFNGDNYIDVAILVKNRLSSEVSLMIVHSNINKVSLMGGGVKYYDVDETLSFDVWTNWGVIFKSTEIELNQASSLWFEKLESSSASMHWNGEHYILKWSGD